MLQENGGFRRPGSAFSFSSCSNRPPVKVSDVDVLLLTKRVWRKAWKPPGTHLMAKMSCKSLISCPTLAFLAFLSEDYWPAPGAPAGAARLVVSVSFLSFFLSDVTITCYSQLWSQKKQILHLSVAVQTRLALVLLVFAAASSPFVRVGSSVLIFILSSL